MVLDNFLLNKISDIAGVNDPPKDLDEIYNFFCNLKVKMDSGDYKSELIGFIFYNFLTKKEIRDRKVTSRIFEDIMAKLFKGQVLDEEVKSNPCIPENIKLYDKLHETTCKKFKFLISQDLAGNKREKADNHFGNYSLSLKTLKGKLYNKDLIIEDNKFNNELNIGSLSYRALLVDLLTDEELSNLSDRKGGLGSNSKSQLIKTIYIPLYENGKWEQFVFRLKDFLNYIYSESDFIILFKSGYKMTLYFIYEQDFIDELINFAKNDPLTFFDIFYRWENNNLRIHYLKLFENLKKKSKIKKVEFNFNNLEKSSKLQNKFQQFENIIDKLFIQE